MHPPDDNNNGKKKTTSEVIKEINDDLKRRFRLPDPVMDAMLRELMNGGLVSDVEPDPGQAFDPKYAHEDIYECSECHYAGDLKDVSRDACPNCNSTTSVWIHNIERAGKMNY